MSVGSDQANILVLVQLQFEIGHTIGSGLTTLN